VMTDIRDRYTVNTYGELQPPEIEAGKNARWGLLSNTRRNGARWCGVRRLRRAREALFGRWREMSHGLVGQPASGMLSETLYAYVQNREQQTPMS